MGKTDEDKYYKAIESYDEVLNLEPNNILALEALRFLYSRKTKQLDKARETSQRLVDLNKQHPQVVTYLVEDLIKGRKI